MNPKSIRFRLICWYTTVSLLVAMAFSAYTYFRLEYYLREGLAESLDHRARQIADHIISRIPSAGEAFAADEIEARYTPGTSDKFIRVTRADGSLLYLSGEPAEGKFIPSQIPKASVSAALRQTSEEVVLRGGGKLLIASVPCQADAKNYLVEVEPRWLAIPMCCTK